jgi:SAM-dependent methyltransferase
MSVNAAEAKCRVRNALERLARSGKRRVLLYGAGRHTLKAGEALADAPVQIVGIVDDYRGGRAATLWNWPILSPDEATRIEADAVLVSSDGLEQRLYDAARRLFAHTDTEICRLYATNGDATGGSDRFIDEAGKSFDRIDGYRDLVKPGWQDLLDWEPGHRPLPTLEQARAAMDVAGHRVAMLQRYLHLHGRQVEGLDVLEIGCWDGSCCFALARAGAARVLGIDHQDYFLWNEDPDRVTDTVRRAGRNTLEQMQAIIREAATDRGPPGSCDRVALRIDDIRTTNLPGNRFDLICSWGTLEHVVPPDGAFRTVARLLKPGGACFHEYSAFTCREGGHALCTLDFPWGHVRLSDCDVDRYFADYRPREHAHAIRHYRHFLNRLTLADVERRVRDHGLTLRDRTVWLNRHVFEQEFEPEHLEDARRHYPDITVEDLVHDAVWLLLEKPVSRV